MEKSDLIVKARSKSHLSPIWHVYSEGPVKCYKMTQTVTLILTLTQALTLTVTLTLLH